MELLWQCFNYIIKFQGPFSALASKFPSLVGAIAATERLMEIEELSLEKHKDLKEGINRLCLPKVNNKKIINDTIL